MDTRGQGGRWTFGATGDAGSGGPENSPVMTSPETFYYTRLFTDAALAVDAAAERQPDGPDLPPSTVFAAYNEITAAKDIAVHPFSKHDVPHGHSGRRIRHLREHLS